MIANEYSEIHSNRFRHLMKRITNSPLYRNKLCDIDLEDMTLEDIRRLPVTTKSELREAGQWGILAASKEEIAQYHESSGSSGIPSIAWFTRNDLVQGGSQLRRTGSGLTSHDLVLNRFPYALALPAFLIQEAAWQAGAGIVPSSSRNTITHYPKVLELIGQLECTIIAGLPREMELLAETARLLGFDCAQAFPNLRAIWVAGELFADARKRHVEKLWGVPVYNFFGSTETGNIATMCSHGRLHISEEDFYLELLELNSTNPINHSEIGQLLVTTLSHEGSPLLRYVNEDLVTFNAEACLCGHTGRVLTHHGRVKDMIQIDDTRLTAKDIHEGIYSLTNVPAAWNCRQLGGGLEIHMDMSDSSWNKKETEEHLASSWGLGVSVVDQTGMLLDRTRLVQRDSSLKPVYII
ncbi:phenylacetate--CoA ligase family protein [Paenibacillus sp. L3-i20]|uniref:phenylacetate--CoA ligase family protein n=1 Tax=Paenibacillus sp. L3-i20 TaxID=2905833 RepID=UPI001EDEFD5A|nr:AMP-binding protein [Paenibacillus sp. L3-i20]GKU77246.1 phenylacetate--CoA ligase [Paenibacillus sp. L3-i20]